jgi:phytoene desaturase
MARICRELGVDIQLGQDVQEVLMEKGKAAGVRLKDQTLRCDALVINADFARAMTRLVAGNTRRRWSDSKLAKMRYSCSTYMMYLGIEGRYDHLDHHNIFISSNYQRNMHEIEHSHTLSDDPSFYVANPGITDDTMAPPGMSSLYILVPVSHMHPNIDWQTQSASFRQLVLQRLKQIGLDDLESRIRFERICTPADWQDKFEIYRGATFNLSHDLRQMLHLRPPNRFDEIKNTYLVGGGTHPGSGLPVIFESAKISSRLLLEDLA